MAKIQIGMRSFGLAAAGIGGGLLSLRLLRSLRAIDLRGQVVLITGASRGLGYALTEEFARQGARLAICARDGEMLARAAATLEREIESAEVLALTCDIAKREQVEQLVEQATAHYGRIDVLVHNAGEIMVGPFLNQALEDFEEEMATTFWGGLYATLAVLPQMRARGSGRIVHIGSIGGKVSVPHLTPYSSAKFALIGLSEGLRAELARKGITITTIAPGLMRTGSPINAFVKGDHSAEYTWFTLGDSLPLISMSACRAARQIVAATRRGDAEVILGLPAALLSLFHGAFPGLTSDIMGVINRFLPSGEGASMQRWRGAESETAITQSFLTTLTRKAAAAYQQHPPSIGQSPRTS